VNSLNEKPTVRYNLHDWKSNKHSISSDAEGTRNVSFQVRQEGRHLNNETENKTWWDTHDNNVRLADRLDDIEEWRQILRYQIKDIDNELEAIRVAKNFCENMLNEMKLPLDVNRENLATRDARRGIDLVLDEANSELNNVRIHF
jgi:tektin-2